MKRDFVIRRIESARAVQKLAKHVHPLAAKVLVGRGMKEEDIDSFLNGSLENLHDPHQILDMDKGTDMVMEAIENGDEMAVYGDYDSDGVTGTAIFYEALQELGANVRYRLPDRHKEGYGMHPRVVQQLHSDGVKLILTVDNGIRAHHAIEVAKGLGMSVVVVDHHEPSDTLPIADAICNINRHDDPYPFKGISGAAMAYKFLQVLYEKMGWPMEEADKFLDLVAIAAIADVMPLYGESRILVTEGLKWIGDKAYDRVGLLALKEAMGITDDIRAIDIGFRISPAINAAGRLYKADVALDLLLEKNPDVAREKAKALCEVNNERKLLTDAAVARAMERIEATMKDDPIIVMLDRQTPEGIVGLVAGRITEKLGKMSVVFTEAEASDGEGNKFSIYKASCRAPGGYHILHALESCDDILRLGGKPAYGGHEGAAGCSMMADRELLDEFRQRLVQYTWDTYGYDLKPPVVEIDSILSVDDVDHDLIEGLRVLEPFGHMNERPMFLFTNFEAVEREMPRFRGPSVTSHFMLMGKPNKIHVKVFGETVNVVGWRLAEDYETLGRPQKFAVCGTVEESTFQGETTLVIEAKYLLPIDYEWPEELIKTDATNKLVKYAVGM